MSIFLQGQGQFRRTAELDLLQADPEGRGAWTPRVNSRDCAEAYMEYVAQAIPQIDVEIAEKDHFWMETS